MNIRLLVGSGDRIGKFMLPFIVVGVALNVLRPSWFSVGGPPDALRTLSMIMLIPGVVGWLWSAVLILRLVPRGQLIVVGPFAIVKHPLYTSVSLLVLPWVGFLLDSWLGAALGLVLYAASRMYAPQEEEALSAQFGSAWDNYADHVMLPWL